MSKFIAIDGYNEVYGVFDTQQEAENFIKEQYEGQSNYAIGDWQANARIFEACRELKIDIVTSVVVTPV